MRADVIVLAKSLIDDGSGLIDVRNHSALMPTRRMRLFPILIVSPSVTAAGPVYVFGWIVQNHIQPAPIMMPRMTGPVGD